MDGTLGGGGHAYEIARRLSDKGSIIGIDQDAAAIEAAGNRLKDFGEKVTIVRSNYCDMKSKLHELGIDKSMGSCLIWACHLISWTRQNEDSLIAKMHLWICGWIHVRR